MIGIAGFGFVGKAVGNFAVIGTVEVYDPYIEEYKDNIEKTMQQDYVFVCVPTNTTEDGQLDISIVRKVARLWRSYSKPSSILIIKSTVPVGTTIMLQKELGTNRIVFNPEFLTERTANINFMTADEVILGGDPACCREVKMLYQRLLGDRIRYTMPDATTAELIKLARNSLYAVKVEFMNEIRDLCDAAGIDYGRFREAFVHNGNNAWVADQHTYVPGPDGHRGFGGKCFPKDTKGLLAVFRILGCDAPVLASTIDTNEIRRRIE